jgi:hypothetical protein
LVIFVDLNSIQRTDVVVNYENNSINEDAISYNDVDNKMIFFCFYFTGVGLCILSDMKTVHILNVEFIVIKDV